MIDIPNTKLIVAGASVWVILSLIFERIWTSMDMAVLVDVAFGTLLRLPFHVFFTLLTPGLLLGIGYVLVFTDDGAEPPRSAGE